MKLKLRLLVNKEFQLKMVGILVFVAIIIGAFFVGINVVMFNALGERLTTANNISSAQMFLREIAHITLITYFIAISIMILLFAFLGLYLSNQVAGPIWRVEQHIKQRLSGAHHRNLKFRKHDFFPELAEQINLILPGKDDEPQKPVPQQK